MWHASIAKHKTDIVPTNVWGDGVIRDAKHRILLCLGGVGQGPTILTKRRIAIHCRRSLSDSEIAALSPEWLAIPARDEFSEDGEIEMEL